MTPLNTLPESVPNVGRVNPVKGIRLGGKPVGATYAADTIVTVLFCAAGAAETRSCGRFGPPHRP